MPKRTDILDRERKEMEQPKDELLTIHEVALRLRVDDTTVRRWINSGSLEALTLPHMGKRRGYRVKQSILTALLTQTTTLTTTATR